MGEGEGYQERNTQTVSSQVHVLLAVSSRSVASLLADSPAVGTTAQVINSWCPRPTDEKTRYTAIRGDSNSLSDCDNERNDFAGNAGSIRVCGDTACPLEDNPPSDHGRGLPCIDSNRPTVAARTAARGY